MPKLYEIEEGSKIRCDHDGRYDIFYFKHVDGMYSFCESEDGRVLHLSAMTPLEKNSNGEYLIVHSD